MKFTCLATALITAATLVPVCSDAMAAEKLIFAIDVIRHGDRTPLGNLPTVSYQWKQGFGQLTPIGMRQEYQLGSRQRAVYVDQYHLLPKQYQAGTLYVRSSDVDRTLMSAESFLMGLYPRKTGPHLANGEFVFPQGYQPVPIRTVPLSQEKLLIPDNAFYHVDELFNRYVYSTEAWQKKSEEVSSHFAAWSKATGVPINALKDVNRAGDRLYISQLYHLPLPAGLTQKDAKELIDTGRWAFAAEFRPAAVGKITGSRLLRTIASYLQRACEQKTALKYVLFSAHDSTLLSEMSALEAPLDQPPHYASNLNFMLFADDERTCRVQVKFNDKPVVVPKCGGSTCTLEQFVSLANEPLPQPAA